MKVAYFKNLAHIEKSLCVALTTSNVTAEVLDVELYMLNYILHTTDHKQWKQKEPLFIQEEPATNVLLSQSNKMYETLIMNVIDLILTTGTMYRHRDAINFGEHFREDFSRIIQTLNDTNPQVNLLLMGNFNFPNLGWPDDNIQPGNTRKSKKDTEVLINTTK